MLIVGAAALFLVWLMISVLTATASLGDKPPGRQFMLLVANWGAVSIALKALPPLITIGIGILARYRLRDWQFYGTVVASAMGIAAAVYLLAEVSSVDTARRFWAYSPVNRLEDYDAFVGAAQTGLGSLVVWFVAVLGIQLGVKQGTGS
jgi:hypothetical protein